LQGVIKDYGAVVALKGLDLTVRRGEIFGFLGRNGAGKSTALRIIMGVTRATRGQVTLFGATGAGDDPSVRRRIGYVAQEHVFYGWMDVLQLGRFLAGFYPTWDDAEYRRLRGMLQLPVVRRIQTFSGGMQAKLALAVALAHRPELLVLDEPTAGMDPVARREFLDLVRVQARSAERTTILSTHLIDEVEDVADTIGILNDGALAWQGRPAALRDEFRVLRRRVSAEEPGAAAAPALPYGVNVLEDRVEGDLRTIVVRVPDPALLPGIVGGAPGWDLSAPSLEEAFIAFVRGPMRY
jgi:ABC-2 type transport system ATP-binding protein